MHKPKLTHISCGKYAHKKFAETCVLQISQGLMFTIPLYCNRYNGHVFILGFPGIDQSLKNERKA